LKKNVWAILYIKNPTEEMETFALVRDAYLEKIYAEHKMRQWLYATVS